MDAVDAVVGETRRTAENKKVAGPEDEPLFGVAAPQAADVERRIIAERNGNDRCRPVVLILVPVRAHSGGWCIIVDEAGFGAGRNVRNAVP